MGTLNLLTKKIGKFLRNSNKDKSQSLNRNNPKKSSDLNYSNYTCFGCGKQEHIKIECHIAWQDNDQSSFILTSRGDEEANLCLMAKDASNMSSVSSNSSENFENYNQLLDAFRGTHEEANRMDLLNNRLKGLNNWLENKVKSLEKELNNTKIDFENLEFIYKNWCELILGFFI